MNLYHRWLCRSQAWSEFVSGTVIPESLGGVGLGDRVLELGPGYGASTGGLLSLVPELVVLEPDPRLGGRLGRKFGARLEVVQGDATRMPFGAGLFSAVVCFTMLHHLPSAAAQDRLFAEVARVLRPGGVFVASDSRGGWRFRLIHLLDNCTPMGADGLERRLQRAGLDAGKIEAGRSHIALVARSSRSAQDPGPWPRPTAASILWREANHD
ncbi:MAG: class I SAM-dependent methyltransferase [Candidatus Dormiibacterota bacterium]|jgi:SAM-dependent methyltransferase